MSFNKVMDNKSNPCSNCSKWNKTLLRDLSDVELDVLNQNKISVSYKSGEIICKEGTNSSDLICLSKGKVKIVKKGVNGTEQIVGLKKPGDFIGFPTFMADSTCPSSSVALKKSSVCIIRKKDFFKVLEGNKKLAKKIIQSFALEIINSDNRLVNLTQKHIRSRLAETLLLINDIYGTNSDTGILKGSLKRSDLAGLSNMTTANVIRTLSSLNKEKLIEVNHRSIKIIDLEKLIKISNSGQ